LADLITTSVFDLEYFSAAQCSIYIGDVWVDEVVALNYSTQQMKSPIYGYASQLWDDCAAGHVIVQGSFAINFKEQGYLWAVLQRYSKMYKTEYFFDEKFGKLFTSPGGKVKGSPITKNEEGTTITRETIEALVRGDVPRSQRDIIYSYLAGYPTFKTTGPADRTFDDLMTLLEEQVWDTDNKELIPQLRRTDDNKFDGFDMYVVFGNYSNPRAHHTVQKIIDVRLVSQGKTIQVGGGPVREEYSFIARTVT
jgi:hypothetical protein